MKKENQSPQPTSLRLPPELKKRIERIAKKEHRSTSAQICVMLEELLASDAGKKYE